MFPEKFFLFLLTLRMFFEWWLVGIFGYLFFREELGDKKWAFFASAIYQLSGYVFFSVTTYAHLTIFLFETIAFYVFWTLDKRKYFLSYLYLTLSVVAICLSGNLVYTFAAFLTLSVLFIFRRRTPLINVLNPPAHLAVALGALVTGAMISMVRVLPFIYATFRGGRIGGVHLAGIVGNIYLAITAFIPEAMGVQFGASLPIIYALTGLHGRHSQFHTFNYFGALPMALLIWSMVAIREKRINFWLIYFFIASVWLLVIQPFSDILDLIFYPFQHTIIPKMMIPVAFCAVAGHAGRYLEKNPLSFKETHLKIFTFIAWGILSSIAVIYVYYVPAFINPARLAVLTVLGAIFLGFFLHRPHSNMHSKAPTALAALALALTFYLAWLGLKLKDHPFFYTSFVYVLASLSGMFTLYALFQFSKSWNKQITGFLVLFLTVGTFFVLLYPFPGMTSEIPSKGLHILAGLGFLRLFTVGAFFAVLLAKLKSGELRPSGIFVIFLALVLVDLLPFNKAYSRLVTEPFFNGKALYAPAEHLLHPMSLGKNAIGQKNVNLIKNGSFEIWGEDHRPKEWVLGGKNPSLARDEKNKALGKYGVALTYGNADACNLYQDVKGPNFQGKAFTFGTWVKTSVPHQARLLLTDKKNGSFSSFHTGGGGWEWLVVTHVVNDPSEWIRPHISIASPGTLYADGALLMEGYNAPPFEGKSDDMAFQKAPDFRDATPPTKLKEDVNTADFRLNNPHKGLGISGNEIFSNIPSVYGVRSYGGVNSQVDLSFGNLMQHFNPSLSVTSSGFCGDEKNKRLLDLMGCRYDADEGRGAVEVRPSALSRLMLFRDFEIVENDEKALKRLSDEDFTPRQKVILASDPGIAKAGPSEGLNLKYRSFRTSQLELDVETTSPAILFFNDSYHQDWKAYVNGKEESLIRANYNFMAIKVPSGKSKVVFRFEPAAFRQGLLMTIFGLVLFVLFIAVLYFIEKGKK